MLLSEIIKNIPHTDTPDTDISSICYDSRKAESGDLFVCLVGAKTDGHSYAPRAYENGCRAFLCERRIDTLPEDAIQIITPDTRHALAVCGADFYGRPAEKLNIIGITGTKGKTTTSLLCAAILNAAGKNCAYIGSNGVIINGKRTETVNTTPESLELHHYFSLMVNSGVEYAVIEVSSQALAHNRVEGIPFAAVAFTNLSEDHIGEAEHPTFEHYKNSKKRLFTEYKSNVMIYNADDSASAFMREGYPAKTVSFGITEKADWTADNIERFRDSTTLGVSFDVHTVAGDERGVKLLSPGFFSVYNGLCAMAICCEFGVSKEFARNTLAKTPVQGRFEIVEGTPGRTFIIDYSHNGFSLTNALKTLKDYDSKRIICVFGSVGGRTQNRRRELAEAASKYADYSIITSDNPDFEDPDEIIKEIASHMSPDAQYECITDRRDAIYKAVNMADVGDIVLFAGKGHETYQYVCGKKVPFSEREHIEAASALIYQPQ